MATVDQILNLNFDQQYGLNKGLPSEEIALSERGFKELPVKIKLAEKRSDQEESDVDEKKVDDATKAYKALVGETRVGDIQPVNLGVSRLSGTEGLPQMASIDPSAKIDISAADAVVPKQEAPTFMEANEIKFEPTQDLGVQTSAGVKAAEFVSSDTGQDVISTGMDFLGISNKPVKEIGSYQLPGYQTAAQGSQAMKLAEMRGSSGYYQTTGAPTLTGQLAGVGSAALGAYSAYDALKGGIDSPTEALQFAGGTLGTLAGLQTAGIMAGSQFATMMAGPVGWAIAGATFLASSGILGGKGNSKPPMGGVEFRLVDDAGKQYARPEEGQKRRIKAVNAHSYNGFNSSALQAQANKNVDYMYAFADEFGLKVNEGTWANAAFGGDGVEKYMPRGREAPYRSVLERIDSMGDGSVSPSEWLRHAMEYEGPNGERIVEGDIYKGTKIGPDGMPMKVGYKTQEEFQEAVANFNQKFFA